MKKSQVNQFPVGSAEYVVAHAKWQSSRGKQPSITLPNQKNPRIALQIALELLTDHQYSESIVESTNIMGDSMLLESGRVVFIESLCGVSAKIGDTVRIYENGGLIIKGITVNGIICFYKSATQVLAERKAMFKRIDEDELEDFRKNRDSLDQAYNQLPEFFRKRIDNYRSKSTSFRLRYEKYEIFCDQQAVILAESIRGLLSITDGAQLSTRNIAMISEIFEKFEDMDSYDRQNMVPGWDIVDHSNATEMRAINLAKLFLLKDWECIERTEAESN